TGTSLGRHGQCHDEAASVPRTTLGDDFTAVALYDTPTHREAHSRALELASSMKPLERRKDALGVFDVESDAVVLHRDPALRRIHVILDDLGHNPNPGRDAIPPKLQGIVE